MRSRSAAPPADNRARATPCARSLNKSRHPEAEQQEKPPRGRRDERSRKLRPGHGTSPASKRRHPPTSRRCRLRAPRTATRSRRWPIAIAKAIAARPRGKRPAARPITQQQVADARATSTRDERMAVRMRYYDDGVDLPQRRARPARPASQALFGRDLRRPPSSATCTARHASSAPGPRRARTSASPWSTVTLRPGSRSPGPDRPVRPSSTGLRDAMHRRQGTHLAQKPPDLSRRSRRQPQRLHRGWTARQPQQRPISAKVAIGKLSRAWDDELPGLCEQAAAITCASVAARSPRDRIDQGIAAEQVADAATQYAEREQRLRRRHAQKKMGRQLFISDSVRSRRLPTRKHTARHSTAA